MVMHDIYGLLVATDRPIPRLPVVGRRTPSDVRLVIGELPSRTEVVGAKTDIDSGVVFRDGAGYTWFRYYDGIEFAIDSKADTVWVRWPDTLLYEDAAINLLGSVFGFLLRLRGILCLHASGVVVHDRCAVFVGPGGAGKSTLAAVFAVAGDAVVSDDVIPVVVTDHARAIPGYPQLRLWFETVEALFGSPQALPLLTPNWNKQFLDVNDDGYTFERTARPISAIYLVERRPDGPSIPEIDALDHRSAFFDLIANTHMSPYLDRSMREREFHQVRELVLSVPVRKLRIRSDRRHLCDVRHSVLEDLTALSVSV